MLNDGGHSMITNGCHRQKAIDIFTNGLVSKAMLPGKAAYLQNGDKTWSRLSVIWQQRSCCHRGASQLCPLTAALWTSGGAAARCDLVYSSLHIACMPTADSHNKFVGR